MTDFRDQQDQSFTQTGFIEFSIEGGTLLCDNGGNSTHAVHHTRLESLDPLLPRQSSQHPLDFLDFVHLRVTQIIVYYKNAKLRLSYLEKD